MSATLSDIPVPFGAGTGGQTGVTTLYTTSVLGDPLAWQGSAIINEYTVMTIPGAWRAIDYLSSTIAHLPKDVIQKVNGLNVCKPEHPNQYILNEEVNNLNTCFTFWQTLVSHAVDFGNGYASLSFENGKPVAMYNLPPDRCIPFRYMGNQYYSVVVDGYDMPIAVPGYQILHLPGLGFDGMKGYPVVQLMTNALRIGKAAELFSGDFFRNGASGIGSLETDQRLTPEQLQSLRTAIREQHVGLDHSHQWLILQGGLKAKPFTLNPVDSELLATRQFSDIDICRIFGVPPHVLYEMDRQTWNNISAMQVQVVKDSLSRWIVPLEQEIKRKLFTQQERKAGYGVRFDVRALERGDTTQRIDNMTKRLGNGIACIDEERAEWSLPSIGPAGKIHMVPANWQNVERLLDQPQELDQPESAGADEFAKATVDLDAFADLITDAADRVHRKTAKATSNALAKHGTNSPNWTPFANAFADQQAKYSAQAITPVLATFARVTGHDLDPAHHAQEIGQQYANALRPHLYAIGRGEQSSPPDLGRITHNYEGTKWKKSF
jgi:HK97 family phage portal protein